MKASAAYEPPLQVRFSPYPGGLQAHVSGANTLGNTIGAWQAIAAEVRRRGAKQVLLVDGLQGEPLTTEQWRLMVEALLGHAPEGVRIAHVTQSHGLQQVEQCEIYAREAGFDVHVFDNERSADLWLRQGER